MAYKSCAADLAANIQKDCDHPSVNGFTGRGILIPWEENPAIVQSGVNPRILTSITMQALGDKVCVIDNVWTDSFNGTGVQSNGDNGRVEYVKTVVVRIPRKGADTSMKIVEPLIDSAKGFLLILERKDKVGDGSFPVFGFLQPVKANADGIVQNEYENGGDIVATLSCREAWEEVVMFDTDYATTLAMFETLMTSAF